MSANSFGFFRSAMLQCALSAGAAISVFSGLAVAQPSATAAASGTVGPHTTPNVECGVPATAIHVDQPKILAVNATNAVDQQWVTWRSRLYQWRYNSI